MVTLRWDSARNASYLGTQDLPRMGRKIKACIPCHERKVRCDAAKVGTPCSRCNDKNRTHICVMLQASDRHQRTLKRKRGADSEERRKEQDHLLTPSPIQTSSPSNKIPLDRISHSTFTPLPTTSHSPDCSRSHPQTQSAFPSLLLDNSPSSSTGELPKHDPQIQMGKRVYQFVHERPRFTGSESSDDCDDMIDYHDGTNSITILSEALGPSVPKVSKPSHISSPWSNPPNDIGGLCDVDAEYLRQKGAFAMPSRHICDKLLHLFVERVYIAVPVVDRVRLVQEYRQGTLSTFLLQSIMASVIPQASMELLNEAGFEDRSTAQETFFARAKLLHDFDIEKNQLRILQGSLILSVTHVSHYMPRDYRYWLSNAACIATKMGLHRNTVRQRLDISTKKLLRRIWWTLYTWDAILALNGMDTMRRFHDNDFDTPHLTEEDWDEDIPPALRGYLQPTTSPERFYLIESSKLSLIIGRFWHKFPTTSPEVSFDELENAIHAWRQTLPAHLKVISSPESATVGTWNLTLMARSYICECIMYRMIRRSPSAGEHLIQQANQRLYNSMFELDCIIERIMNQDSGHFNTWLLPTFIATTLALHVEKVLNPSTTTLDGVLAKLRIHGKLEFLREMSKTWPYINSLVKMLEGVMRSTNLSIPVSDALPGVESSSGCDEVFENDDPSSKVQASSKPPMDLGNNSWCLNFVESEDTMPFDLPIGTFNTASLFDEMFTDNSNYWNGTEFL